MPFIDTDLFSMLEASVNNIEADSPYRLNEILKEFDYGYLKNGTPCFGPDFKDYKTISPYAFEKYRIGTSFDYVSFEYEFFKKEFVFDKLNIHTYFIQEYDGYINPSHAWLTYEFNDYVNIFEAAWKDHKGIFEYDSRSDMFKDYIKKFINNNGSDILTAKYVVLEYKPLNVYGLTYNEYLKYIYSNSKIITNTGVNLLEFI